ncbi:hypothetical protein BS78_07G051700 [Paspalum vaginatum]|nr:hypothetical protein BS78_07G051700 [Paspalum vaginatum]
MDAGRPSAKRTRSGDVAPAGEAPPRPREATEATSPQRQPDAGGEDGAGVDHISGLHDSILGEIISLLSTKEAARTRILASRWRRVWRASPLIVDRMDLDDVKELPQHKRMAAEETRASVVSHILSTHPGPCRRFCVLPYHLQTRAVVVDRWLRSPALDNLQELDFWHNGTNMYPPLPLSPPPASVFRFSDTLRPDVSIGGLHFPNLKHLALQHVSISEGSLHTMIHNCPVLECLWLRYSSGFSYVRISSSSLKSICLVTTRYMLQEVTIVDAPGLERFLFQGISVNASIISAPKLETLGCICDAHGRGRLVIGNTMIEGLQVIKLTTVVQNIKILAVQSWHIDLDIIIELMKCFPCLEKLYVKARVSGNMNRWRRKHRQFIDCFDIRLKTIVLEQYRGTTSQVNFVSFFLLNARELQLMTLVVDKGAENEAFLAEQHKVLQMEDRASRGAQLHFTPKSCYHGMHVSHVRDLAITDPFECSSQNCSLGVGMIIP